MERLLPSAFGAGVGLTMSEESGLDEVEEVLRAAASCARSAVISARRAFSCAWSHSHSAQELVVVSMSAILLRDLPFGPSA